MAALCSKAIGDRGKLAATQRKETIWHGPGLTADLGTVQHGVSQLEELCSMGQ